MRALLLACLFVFTCCASAHVTPLQRYDVVAYETSPIYAKWWRELEECTGYSGNPVSMRFYSAKVMPDNSWWGVWYSDHSIWIVRGRELDSKLIKHEMLHELLDVVGEDNGHENKYFNQPDAKRCGLYDGNE